MAKKGLSDEKIFAYAVKNAVEHNGKAVVGSVLSSLFAEGLQKEQIRDMMLKIAFIVEDVNKMGIDLQRQRLEEYESKGMLSHREVRDPNELPELPNVNPKTGVIMRFAPAASGGLHIGNIISNMISSLYVKKYGGKFYVRIEDTDPERIEKEAYGAIKKDCDWIFDNVSEYIIQSDRISIYYKYAEELIKKNFAYVCTCPKEKFKELIENEKGCPCRSLSEKENMKRWKSMLDKKGFKEGEAVLRFKSNIKNNNPAMRDFPLARINEAKHPLQGNKYRVWPLMNLSVAVDDIAYKMTHVIRGKEHRDNAERQKMIYRALGKLKEFPWTFFMGRIKFSDIVLSKRKIKQAIKEGEYEGWDDERLPTISSLRKRGYKPEAFAKLATQRGLTEVDKVMSQKDFFDVLDRFNE